MSNMRKRVIISRVQWEDIGKRFGWLSVGLLCTAKNIKNYVNQYKLQDPHFIFFLNQYESIIPWERVETPEQVSQYIVDILIPQLYGRIDSESESNNYMKDIDLEREFRNNPNDPQVQQAYEVYQQDPAGAKRLILEHINGSKKKAFFGWWDYLTKGNDIYAKSPAFQYSVLKPMIDSSSETNKSGILSLNAMALAPLYQKIKGNPSSFKIKEWYKDSLDDVNIRSSNFKGDVNARDGWLIIPSEFNDPDNFKENVDKLRDFSIPNRWCTGSGMEEEYLGNGDFHLLIKGGIAVVAIRMEGDLVAEVQGKNNERPFSYWEEILGYAKQNGLEDNENNSYNGNNLRSLGEAVKFNRELDEDPEKIKGITIEDLVKFSKENVKKYKNELAPFWVKLISQDPFLEVPKELKDHSEIKEAQLKGFVTIISNTPFRYNECPEEFKGHPEIKKAQFNGWFKYLDSCELYGNEYSNNFESYFLNCPEEIQKRSISKIAERLRLLLKKEQNAESGVDVHSSFIKIAPDYLLSEELIREMLVEMVVSHLGICMENTMSQKGYGVSVNDTNISKLPESIKNDSRVQQVIRDEVVPYWVKIYADSPNLQTSYIDKEELEKYPEIKDAKIRGWIAQISNSLTNCDNCPEEFKGHPEIKRLCFDVDSWVKNILRYPPSYKSCPEELKKHPRVREAYLNIDSWVKFVLENPGWGYESCPEELKKDPRIREARINGWAKLLSKNEYNQWKKMFDCPLELKHEPIILEAFKKSFIDGLSNAYCEKSVERMLSDIHLMFGFGWGHEIRDAILQDGLVMEAAKKGRANGWIREFKTDSRGFRIGSKSFYDGLQIYGKIPEEYKSDTRLKDAAANYFAYFLKKNPDDYKRCPEDLKNHPSILAVLPGEQVGQVGQVAEVAASCVDRLFSSAFNDNYIGKLNL